jgi:hypothetical protein
MAKNETGEVKITKESLSEAQNLTVTSWVKLWAENTRGNIPHIEEDFKLKPSNAIHSFNKDDYYDPSKWIVCASGPSIEKIQPYVKDWPGVIVCGPTNAAVILANGREPDFIICSDAGKAIINSLQSIPWKDYKTKVVFPTHIHPEVADLFPSERRYWFKSFMQVHPNSVKKQTGQELMFNTALHGFVPEVQDFMLQGGCTTNQELMFVQHFRTHLKLNVEKVFLAGVDFGFPKGKARSIKYKYVSDKEIVDVEAWKKGGAPRWLVVPPPPERADINFFRDAKTGILTNAQQNRYYYSLMFLWAITKLPMYSISDGIVRGIPKVNYRSVFKRGGKVGKPYTSSFVEETYKDFSRTFFAEREGDAELQRDSDAIFAERVGQDKGDQGRDEVEGERTKSAPTEIESEIPRGRVSGSRGRSDGSKVNGGSPEGGEK